VYYCLQFTQMGVGNIAAQFLASSGSMVCLRFLFVFCVTFFFLALLARSMSLAGRWSQQTCTIAHTHYRIALCPKSAIVKSRSKGSSPLCLMPYALCLVPYALCLMPYRLLEHRSITQRWKSSQCTVMKLPNQCATHNMTKILKQIDRK
jgi:hypothetical protein